jgi:glucose/arabinose dehydrogenase
VIANRARARARRRRSLPSIPGGRLLKSHSSAAVVLALSLVHIGCGEDAPTQPGGNASPTATISAPPTDVTIQVGTAVNFQGTASDPDGQVTTHSWDFDDGSTSAQEDPGNHAFTDVGVYDVTYRVTDDDGATSPADQVQITVQTTAPTSPSLGAQQIVAALGRPVYLTAPPGDARLFVVLQSGRIRIIENDQLSPDVFLDISGQVSSGNEQGLLSMAFHPNYATNGHFYINYTDQGGDTRVVRYTVSGGNANQADAGSAVPIITVSQDFGNHNGGHLMFGEDGMLYMPLGDGGGAGDPNGRGQDPSTLLGSLLRIDVDGGSPYSIPPDNPFASGQGGAPEVWAYGLRNPWRIAFDPVDDILYIADVGQNSREEVNAVSASSSPVNYGWSTMEASACYNPSSGCDQTGLTLPVVEYDHGQGCSITGGFPYRGAAIPALAGHYFYSDFCSGFLRSFRLNGSVATEQQEWNVGDIGMVYSFGQDSAGELYILSTNAGGTVYRLVRTN